jgi:signal transduction histidine kinase
MILDVRSFRDRGSAKPSLNQQRIQLFFSNPRRALRNVEWILIGVQLLLSLLDGSYQYSLAETLKSLVFLTLFAVLSYFIPLQGPLWQRRIYVFLNMLLVVSTIATSMLVSFDLIFLWAIIKTCFLLELKEAIVAVTLTGIAYTLGTALALPNLYAFVNAHGVDEFLTPQNLILGSFTYYLGGCIFSVLLSLMILSERHSRYRAEALAQEVETLSIKLERARIARDLHDSLGHSLTTLGVQLEVAQKMRQHNPEQALQALDTAKSLADRCLDDVRHSVQTIRQTDFHLEQALQVLLSQIRQTQALKVESQISLPLLPERVQQQLYSIVREGLTNIQKHAQAARVDLQIWFTAVNIHLKLVDDGKGFNLQTCSTGFGLRGMQERVESLAGQLAIASHPEQGTTIEVTIPRHSHP